MKATYNGTVIADSTDIIEIEGNQYFPRDSVQMQYLQTNPHQTTCPWKGTAAYYDVTVDGLTADKAAWTYNEPKEDATEITMYVAFWNGVEVTE